MLITLCRYVQDIGIERDDFRRLMGTALVDTFGEGMRDNSA